MSDLAPETLLITLAERRILLACEDGRLRFRAPEGAIDESLRNALRMHKEGLLSALQPRPGFVQLCPLSYNQLSLFFLHLFDPTAPAYNLALTMGLRSPAHPDALREAVARLVQQHSQLRTTFGYAPLGDTAVPCQFTAEGLAPSFEEHDARGWSAEDLRARAQAFYATPLDLENGPVVRTGLFRGATGGDVLILQLHHIAVDGWSLNLVARDLGRHYGAVLGQPSAAAAEAGPYADFSLEQRRWLAQPDGAAQLDYWRHTLQPPPPPLELGAKDRRPALRRAVGATQYFEIDPPARARAEACAARLGVTPFAFLLAAFQAFLIRRTGLNDIAVGVPTLGRRGAKYENTVGYFVNPVALRTRRPPALSFREHAQLTAQELTAALDRRDLPFATLVEHLGGARDPARTPGFQVLFNLLSRRMLGDVVDLLYPGADETTIDLGGGLTAGAFPLHQQEGQFDLTLEFVERGPAWIGLFKYCTDLFTAAEADAMVAEFSALLEQATAAPDTLRLGGATAPSPSTALPAEARRQIVVAATFTAEVMQDAFEFWFERLGWPAELAFAPFNQVLQELLNPASLLRRATRGHSVVFLRCDDLIALPAASGAPGNPAAGSVAERLRTNLAELLAVFRAHAPSLRVPLCVVLCPSSPRLCAAVPEEPALRREFVAHLATLPGVHVLTAETIAGWYPVADWYEPAGEEVGHIPYTPPYLAALATATVRTLHAIGQKPVKALVVDCDGTLWDGVVGEDGPAGVRIGPVQGAFQEFLLEQHRAGVVLCLCSKNQEADVWAVFDRSSAMVLKREHIAFSRINWLPKSENLRALAAEMNIGLNALGFLDDNELERAEVRAGCPAVLCVELPGPWEDRVPYLRHLWPLDRARVTAEDRQRVDHYRAERQRSNLRQETTTFADFLARLDLVVDLRPADSDDWERLAQLMVRTNQFNTTVRRFSVPDLAAYLETPGQVALVTRVRDRFGDYGLVGAALAAPRGETLAVDALLLSCRSLGRGVEYRMVAALGAHAVSAGCTEVEFPVCTTDRNEPARSFLERLARQCAGTRSPDGTLRVAARRLAAVQFAPDAVETPVPTETGAAAKPDEPARGWSDEVVALAAEFTSAAAVETALSRWRERRRPPVSAPAQPAARTLPHSETEARIAAAWRRVLAVSDVGTNENFFEIGGTSLLAAQLALDLRRQGLAVSIVDLFHHPTIAALAAGLRGTAPSAAKPVAPVAAPPGPPGAAAGRPQLPPAFERLRRFRGR